MKSNTSNTRWRALQARLEGVWVSGKQLLVDPKTWRILVSGFRLIMYVIRFFSEDL